MAEFAPQQRKSRVDAQEKAETVTPPTSEALQALGFNRLRYAQGSLKA